MAVQQIPVTVDSAHFDFTVELEGVTYLLELRWNDRASAWFLSIATAEEAPILSGRKVALDVPLWVRSRDARLPPGQLVAVDTAGTGVEPAFRDLGGRVQLLYFEAAELA